MTAADHDDEERALFFVAMSRARENLSISYPRSCISDRRLRPSPLLKHLGEIVHRPDRVGVAGDAFGAVRLFVSHSERIFHRLEHLETYAACPARYRFEHIDGSAGIVRSTGESRCRDVALAALRGIDTVCSHGVRSIPSDSEIDVALASIWRERGPTSEPDEHSLLCRVGEFVRRMSEISAVSPGSSWSSPTWSIAIGGTTVEVAPHRVVEHPWETVVVQIVVASEDEARRFSWSAAIQVMAARQAFPGKRVIAELFRLDGGDRIDHAPLDEDIAVEFYAGILTDIGAERFPPRSSPQCCSTCPFLVSCGA